MLVVGVMLVLDVVIVVAEVVLVGLAVVVLPHWNIGQQTPGSAGSSVQPSFSSGVGHDCVEQMASPKTQWHKRQGSLDGMSA